MKRTKLSLILTLLVLLSWGCHDHSHDHEGAEDEAPTIAVTNWTEKTELFMEYPLFVAGESGRSAIHVTALSDFSPLTEGEAIVGLLDEDGRLHEFRGGVSRPGIFGVDLAVEEPGTYKMTLRVEAPGLEDLHELGKVTVHAAGDQLEDVAEEDHGGISFLKEQQWKLEFGTERVEIRALRSSIEVPASVHPRAGGEASISAPVAGRIDPAFSSPVPGTHVNAGATLARIFQRPDDGADASGLRAALVEAENDYDLAAQELDRVTRLVEARALPARRLNEANAAVAAAEARLKAARLRMARFEELGESSDGSIAVRAPFDGVVAEVKFAPGAIVEQDEFLLRFVDTDPVQIVGAVPERQASKLNDVGSGEFFVNGGDPFPLDSPLAVGRVVEPASRTFDIRFAFENGEGDLRIGQSVRLRLFLGDRQDHPAVPESAVVDDGGTLVLFVQSGGESFERRPVTLGSREGGYVHVLDGVGLGERVVHRGAYLIRLAAMSTEVPAHGHVH